MTSLLRKLTAAFAVMFTVAGLALVTSANPASAGDGTCLYADLTYRPSDPQASKTNGRVTDNGSADFTPADPNAAGNTRVDVFPVNGYTITQFSVFIKPKDNSNGGHVEHNFDDYSSGTKSVSFSAAEYVYEIRVSTNKPVCAQPVGSSNGTGGASGGYWLLGRDGGVFSFGDAQFYGSTGAMRLNSPVNGLTATPSARGYWFVAGDGGVFSFGDAQFYGSTGAMRLNQPVVGMTRTESGKGYWLVATDGGIFSFGDAQFKGSTGAMRLNKPIVGMAATPSGKGYWLLAADGGLFAFGDAQFKGSLPGLSNRANSPAVRMAATPSGNGYWIATADGRVYPFGDATFYGDNPKTRAPIVGLAVAPDGNGYWLSNAMGDVFVFGAAGAHGSVSDLGIRLAHPIVGMDSTESA